MKIARRQLGLFILLFAVSSLLVHSPPEAFADVGDITAVRSQSLGNHFTMETKASWNSFVHVDEDTYALAHQNRAGTGAGSISTFTISSDGDTITALDTLQHTAFRGTYNSLVRVDSDTVALAFTGADGNGFITTFTIDSNGNITKVDTLEHDTYQSSTSYNTLLHVNSDMYALAYERSDTNLISTVTIDSDGNITAVKTQSEGNNFQYHGQASDAYSRSLVNMDSDTYALAHGSSAVGIISTFTISSDGETITALDSLEHDADYAVRGSVVKVNSYTVAFAYHSGHLGEVSTFTIGDSTSPTVTITSSTGSSGDTVSDTTLSYTATFSESTSNFVVGDITVTGTANDSSPAASNFAGSGTTYTFDVVKGSSDGTVSVSVAAGAATDAAGNDNTVSNTYTFTIDTTVTSSGASTQGTSCFASPRCAIISVPDGFSINEKSYTLFKNTHTLPTYEAIVGQPVTITLKIPVTSELLQIMSTTIYVEIFNSFEDYEDAARIKYSLTDETIQYTNQSIFEVVGAKNESKLIKLSKDYPENVPESQIPAINFVEITFTMIFAKPMDTSHVVIETEGNYNMHEIIYLRDALVVKENSLNALTLDEVSKIKPELVYDPLPFVDPLKEPSHYIKRYLSEPEYKEWFDTNYPSYTIYEGIGISKFEFDEIVKQLTSPEPSLNNYQGSVIPEWVKNNAAWWSEGVIYDNDFVSGIEFLIKEGVIMVSVTESGEKSDAVIPEWVKNNAAWWSEDIISEKEFLSGIEYLVNNGIIQVN